VFALTIVLLAPVDALILQRFSLGAFSMRAGWALELVAFTLLLRWLPEHRRSLLRLGHGVATSLFFLGLVSFTGGQQSPYFNFVPAMPLLLALIHPQDSRPAISSGAVSTLGVLALLLEVEAPLGQALSWAMTAASATFFGVYGSAQFRKAAAALHEARMERERRETVEKLALAERQRTQSEKLATVGRLAASVMHEVNNPLAFVRSNLQFLEDQVRLQPIAPEALQELEEVIRETQSGVERIQQIAMDLKGFSRMDEEVPSECALADVVTDAARLAAVRLKHVAKLKVEVPAHLEVFATRRRLAQVLLNLLVNASDALEAARVPQGEVRVTGQVQGGRAVLLVEDNGPGFPPQVLPRLFEAFFTTKEPDKGTGLGLSISREMVERYGGTLTAENRPEGGARLRLELPLRETERLPRSA
jgi:signal transduction histidine kinase